MMQQPTQDSALGQHQQAAAAAQQQAAAAAQQQMVLCPVRVVYETQILMPPGEQMNPNQTFYINPQNQPPWANQSAQIYPQNQMVYLQNIPQNIVPAMQQHMDPNQMYIQQTYPTMQQLIQNQNMPVLAQNLQERQVIRQPVQFSNIPQNMNVINVNQYGQMINMQNVANIPQNVPNIVQGPNINQPNVQIMQNQTNSPKPPDVQQSVQNINFAQNIIQNQNIQRAQMVQQQFRMMQQQIVNAQQNQATPKVIQNVQPNVPTTGQMPNQIATNIPQQQQQQTHPQQSQPQQPHPQQSHPQQPHQQQSHPQQSHPQQSHQQQSHPQPSHPQQSHPLQSLPQQPQPQQPQPQQHRIVVQQNVRQTLVQNVPQQTMLQNQNMANQAINVQRNTYIQQQPNVYIRQAGPADSPQYTPTVTNVQPFNQVSADNNKLPIPNQQNTAQKLINLTIKPRAPRPQTKVVPNQQNQPARSMPPQPNRVMHMMQNMSPANNMKPQKKLGCNIGSQVSSPVNPPKPMQMSVATETVNRTALDNKKRKSESPDEAKHKIVAIEANKATYGNPNSYLVNRLKEVKTLVNDVGANPDNSHKDFIKISCPGTQSILDSSVQTETNNIKKPNATITSQDLVGEKLKRNTVFGQARVRNVSNENKTSVDPQDELPTMHITAMEVVTDATISKPEENTVDMKVNRPNKVEFEANQVKVVTFKKPYTPEKKKEDTKELKPFIPDFKPDVKPAIFDTKPLEQKGEDNKIEVKSEPSPNALSEKIRNFSGKQIELSHGNIHKRDGNENNYILTHVLDGIVIQESNVAFPIRLPLKERIIPNAPVKAEPPAKEIEIPTKVMEIQSKGTDPSATETKQLVTVKLKEPKEETSKSSENTILTISELHLDKDVKKSEEQDSKSNINNENPLHCSKPQVVKSWTSEELASHLSKGGWRETASILLDNEIDGESLFLVSNAQLLKIGIDENHAAVLSNFVSS